VQAAKPYRIREYVAFGGLNPFREWLDGLARTVKARVQARILRLETGNLGDYKAVGGGVYEIRLDFGPGYRIYFGFDGDDLIILFCGGSKGSQQRDIRRARNYWLDYMEEG